MEDGVLVGKAIGVLSSAFQCEQASETASETGRGIVDRRTCTTGGSFCSYAEL